MLFETNPILEKIADVIGLIINFLKPYIIPIGKWMVGWITMLLQFFPQHDLTIYFLIFLVLVISAAIINSKWPGDKPKAVSEIQGEKIKPASTGVMQPEKKDIDTRIKCSSCGNPIGNAKNCPYCGAINEKFDEKAPKQNIN